MSLTMIEVSPLIVPSKSHLNQPSIRDWLDGKKGELLDHTNQISQLLDCSHGLVDCSCVSGIKSGVNAIVSISADLRPYMTNRIAISSLHRQAFGITVTRIFAL